MTTPSAEPRGSEPGRLTPTAGLVDHSEEFRPVRVFVVPDEAGGFSAIVPELPGVASQGESIDEAFRMAQEALELAVESYRERGLPIPFVSLAESPVDQDDLRGARVLWTLV